MRWFKRLAIAAGVLALVAAAGLTAFVLLVDPNQYKAPVADVVKKHFDRTLRIDGDLRLSLFPGLGVEATRLSLSEPRSTQIFAAVDSARASVALLPLLSGRIVVDGVKVAGFKANVVRYKNGRFNFEDLAGSQATAPAPGGATVPTAGKPLVFDVDGIEFSNAELALRDYVNGTQMRVERLSATTGRVAPGVPFDFDLSARILGQSPRVDATVQSHGTVSFDPAAQRFAAKGFDLKAVGVLPSLRATALSAHGDIQYDGARQSLDLGSVSIVFQGDVAGERPLTDVDMSVNAPRLGIGLAEDRLQVEKLALRAQGRLGGDPFDVSLSAPALRLSPQDAAGQPVSGRLRLSGATEIDARLGLSGFSGSAERLDIARLSLDGEFRQGGRVVKLSSASPMQASFRHRVLALSQVAGQASVEGPAPARAMQIPLRGSVRANLDKQQLSLKLDATLDGGEFSASADVAQFDEPRVTFSLAADTLDLDRLLPASAAAGTGGGGKAPASQPVDLSALENLTASGTFKIGRLVVGGLTASDVGASVKVARGRAELNGLKASLYGGTLSGSAFAEAGANRIGIAPTLSNVSVQDLLRDAAHYDRLAGRGTIVLNLTAAGKTVQALRQDLGGSASISLRNGAVKGLNLPQALRDFRSMLSLGQDDARPSQDASQTEFSSLQAQIAFGNGVGTVRSLSMTAPLLRLSQGDPAQIDVARSRYDLVALVTVVNPVGLNKDLAILRNLVIPVHLTGPFDAPTYNIQWSRVATKTLSNSLKQGLDLGEGAVDTLRDKLKGLFSR